MKRRKLNDEDAKNISIILKQNTNIRNLYLKHNEISDIGFGYLLESLKYNHTLEDLHMGFNNIQGQDIMRTEFVNNTLEHLYLGSNNITDATAILQNFRGLTYVDLNHNPINFQNAKKIIQDTNLSVKGKYTLKLRHMTVLSDIETKELGIIWKLKLYMYETNSKSLDDKDFSFVVGNDRYDNEIYTENGYDNEIYTENGEVDEYINRKLQPTLSLADFVETMHPIARNRSKTSAFNMKYYIKSTYKYKDTNL